jgi:SAM-dependent methyltransferase
MKNKPKKNKIPWPTKKAMEQIYNQHLWGNNAADFYSGFGSHNPAIVKPYVEVVKEFLTSFKYSLTVCDLGCGDFNIGKELVQYAKNYIAVDIVSDLITHNKEHFRAENLEFNCLNIAIDDLPSGDCALIRQVLQHLSNAEVQSIVNKLSAFKYVILTEHLPTGSFIANKDIISGQGIRLKKHSGLHLLAPPFNFKIKEEKELVSFNLDSGKGVLVTTLYEVF